MKYPKPPRGTWIQPIRRGYKMMCCDCGLVHRMNFRVIAPIGKGRWKVLLVSTMPHKVQFQAFRDNRATGQARRKYASIRVIKGKAR